MVRGRAKGPFLTAVQHKWRELTGLAVRFRDHAPAQPILTFGGYRSDHRRAVAATNPRFRLSLCDLDRAATPRQCCTFATWVRLAKMAGRPPGSRRKKTRRGVPPGHDLVFLDCAGSIQDSGNTCQVINRRTRASRATSRPSCVQRPLRPSHRSALMIERRKIYRPRSVVRPLPSDSCSPPSNPRPAC
jgi:hypothetical protein